MEPQQPNIKCPQCGGVILLDETLAGPVISRVKAEAAEAIKKAEDDAETKLREAMELEATLAAKAKDLADKEASVTTSVNQAIAAERPKIAAAERENALKELAPAMEADRAKMKEMRDKLIASQTAELELRQRKEAVDQKAKELELEVARQVNEKSKAIQEQTAKDVEETIKLKLGEQQKALSEELEAERTRTKEVQDKLALAQAAELKLRLEKDGIDQRGKELDLEVARKVDDQRKAIHEQANKDAEETAKLRLAEKDKIIADMGIKLEEAQRKAVQGSQQLQGEVLELDFESTLRQMFPQDTVEPVKNGARGGDILQHIRGEMGRSAGTLFWETKRAQSWGGDWTTKAKQDAADARAEIATIVSEVLPKGIRDFGFHDGVWCVKPTHAVMLGVAIRQGIIATAEARQRVQGRETKMDLLYEYMIGPEFKTTLEGIALPFRELHEELLAEKRSTIARWKRQEKRIDRVLTSVASLQGDLQGIAGSEMPQLPGFELEPARHENETSLQIAGQLAAEEN